MDFTPSDIIGFTIADIDDMLSAVEAVYSGEPYTNILQVSKVPDLESRALDLAGLLVQVAELFQNEEITVSTAVEILVLPFLKLAQFTTNQRITPQQSGRRCSVLPKDCISDV